MVPAARLLRGFTLIELMVTLAVLVIVAMLAIPSFQAVRQRAALRGAADEVLSFWNQARLEAAKRNSMVKVGLNYDSTSNAYCLGARVTTDPADTSPCDCTVAAPADATTTCDVARFPDSQSEWGNVTLSGVTLGSTATLTTLKPAVIESKRTSLTDPAMAGTVDLIGPVLGNKVYRLRLSVDRFGRGALCEPTSAVAKLSDYANQRCSP